MNVKVAGSFISLIFFIMGLMQFAHAQTARDSLLWAASNGKEAKVSRLMNRGIDPNIYTYEGISPLIFAVQGEHTDIVEILLKNGANPDHIPRDGYAALHSAVINQSRDIVQMLLSYGADVNLKTRDSIAPLHFAAANGDLVSARILLNYGANENIRDKSEKTPIMIAAYNGDRWMVPFLLDYYALVSLQDERGYTALHFAAQEGSPAVTDSLINYGAPVNIASKAGLTPLDVAVKNAYPVVVERLLQAGAQPHKISQVLDTRSLLHCYTYSDTIDKMLQEYPSLPRYLPWFSQLSFGTFFDWNTQDFIWGFQIGALEKKWNTEISAGFGFRPSEKAVREKKGEQSYYQYWESRYYVSLKARKFSPLQKNISDEQGFYLGGAVKFSRAKYAGTTKNPRDQWAFSPGIGYYGRFKWFQISFGYQYQNFHIRDISPHRIVTGVSFYINLNNSMSPNEVYWLE